MGSYEAQFWDAVKNTTWAQEHPIYKETEDFRNTAVPFEIFGDDASVMDNFKLLFFALLRCWVKRKLGIVGFSMV